MKISCLIAAAAAVMSASAAVPSEWVWENVTTGTVLSVDKDFAFPEAFEFEAEFTPDGSKWTDNGDPSDYCFGDDCLWDNKRMPPGPTAGLIVQFCARSAEWFPEVLMGDGRRFFFCDGDQVKLEKGKRARFLFSWDGNHQAVFEFNGRRTVRDCPSGGGVGKSAVAPRVGERYRPGKDPKTAFRGQIHKIAVRALTKAAADVWPAYGTYAFLRGDAGAEAKFFVTNQTGRALADARVKFVQYGCDGQAVKTIGRSVGALGDGAGAAVTLPVETRVKPGWLRITAELLDGTASVVRKEFRSIGVGPLISPEQMPCVAWRWGGRGGGGGEIHECHRAHRLGFTEGLPDLGYNQLTDATEMPAASRRKLDEALVEGVRLHNYMRWTVPTNSFPNLDASKFETRDPDGLNREHTKGRKYWGWEMSSDEVIAFGKAVAEQDARLLAGHPALGGVLTISEVHSNNAPSYNGDRERYRKATGREIPKEVYNPRWSCPDLVALKQKQYPDGLVADDDDCLTYLRWKWTEGSWAKYLTGIADAYRKYRGSYGDGSARQKRAPFFSFVDPTIGTPILGWSGRSDVISTWTYAYPDAMNVGGTVEEQVTQASEYPGQKPMMMTQLIQYRNTVAPTRVKVNPEPKWVKAHPDAKFIAIAPDALLESTWTMIAKPIKGIMYHGYQTMVEHGHPWGYVYSNGETCRRFAEIQHGVVQPLGPSLLRIGRRRQPVMMLESFCSKMFGWRAIWGYIVPPMSVLQRARLDPGVMYEEHVLRGELDDEVKVLYVPDQAFLPRSVAEKIRDWQAKGGILVGDAALPKGLKADISMPFFRWGSGEIPVDTYEGVEADNAKHRVNEKGRAYTYEWKQNLVREGEKLRQALAARGYVPAVDSTTPEIVTYSRHEGEADYVFAINDHRTFGDYIGMYGAVMEKGLPQEGEVMFADPEGKVIAVYELSKAEKACFTRRDGKVVVPVRFETTDGRLFMFLRQRIAKVEVDAPGKIAADGTLKVEMRVLDEAGEPVRAVLPVEIRLFDAAGREIDGAGSAAAVNGIATAEFLTNVDDAKGAYTLKCHDRASGLTVVQDKFIQCTERVCR